MGTADGEYCTPAILNLKFLKVIDMKIRIIIILFGAINMICFMPKVDGQGLLDKPIVITSTKDLFGIGMNWRKDPKVGMWRDPFDEAVTVITAYVFVDFDPTASEAEKNRLLVSLVSGRTPREIIVLGEMLWLERTRRAAAEDEIVVLKSDGKDDGNDKSMRQVATNLGIANEKHALEVIREYLSEEKSEPHEPSKG